MPNDYFEERAGPHSTPDLADGNRVGERLAHRSGQSSSAVAASPTHTPVQTQEDAHNQLHEHLARHPDIGSNPRPLSHPHLLAWHLFNIPVTAIIFFLLGIFILQAYPVFHNYDKTLPSPTRVIGWISISIGVGVSLFLYVLRTPLYYIIEALYEGIAADDGILPAVHQDDEEALDKLSKRAALTSWIANGVLEEVFRLLALIFLFFVSQELVSQPGDSGQKWPNSLENTYWLGIGWNVAESIINLGQNVVNVLATRQSDLRKTLPSKLNRNFKKIFEEQDEREALLAANAAGGSAFSFARDDRGRWGVIEVETGAGPSSSANTSHRPSELEPVQEQDELKRRALMRNASSSGSVSERSSLAGGERADVFSQSNITVRAGRSGLRSMDDPLRMGRTSSIRPRVFRGNSGSAIHWAEAGNAGELSAAAITLSAPTALDLELADILGAPLPYIFPPIYLITRLGAALLDVGFSMLLGQAWNTPDSRSSPRTDTTGIGATVLTLFIIILIRSALNVIYGTSLPRIGLTGAGCIAVVLGLLSVFAGFALWGELF